MRRVLQNILTVSGSTGISRLLGLARDILTAAVLGVSVYANAFLFAFAVPNLFRRLLGEGALTSAFIPVLSGHLSDDGEQPEHRSGFALVNQVLTWAAVVLAALTVLGVLTYFVIGRLIGPEPEDVALQRQWWAGLRLGMALMPYVILVCLAALMGAALNVLDKFAVHALSTVWLNLAMIAALTVSLSSGQSPATAVIWLTYAVLAGGIVQLAVPTACLLGHGWRPRLDFRRSEPLREVVALFVPGLLGAAVMQANILTSRVIAFALNDTAVTTLYLANRLVELPLGLFAIAIATVYFPALSRSDARGDGRAFDADYARALRLTLAIIVPAAAGLAVLAEPILQLLFGYGRFTAGDVALTAPLLQIFALALPFYAAAGWMTKAFHAMKDTQTPVRIAAWTFGLNLVLTLALIPVLATPGMALANTLAAIYQTLALRGKLRKARPELPAIAAALSKVLTATMAMAALVWAVSGGIAPGFPAQEDLLAVGLGIPLGIGTYAVCLWLLNFEDRDELRALLKRH